VLHHRHQQHAGREQAEAEEVTAQPLRPDRRSLGRGAEIAGSIYPAQQAGQGDGQGKERRQFIQHQRHVAEERTRGHHPHFGAAVPDRAQRAAQDHHAAGGGQQGAEAALPVGGDDQGSQAAGQDEDDPDDEQVHDVLRGCRAPVPGQAASPLDVGWSVRPSDNGSRQSGRPGRINRRHPAKAPIV